jgi:hypothetical protein
MLFDHNHSEDQSSWREWNADTLNLVHAGAWTQVAINLCTRLRPDWWWAIAPWETFYSQHDAICNGGKTIIPEEIKGMSFKKLGILIKPK